MCIVQWGQNSGHVGVPLEAIPGFVQRLQSLYQKTTGGAIKSPGGGPKKTIEKGKKSPKDQKDQKERKPKEKKEKKEKEPVVKPSMDDLDAELMSYTAQRGADGDGDAPVEEAAPVS